MRTRVWGTFKVLVLVLLISSCGPPKSVVSVGSMNGTEQRLIGEIVAQHLEKRLQDTEVRRNLGMGDTPIAYQALLSGQIDLYPEYSGAILAEILKEPVPAEADITLERARLEMSRRAQVDLLNPLGFDARFAAVIRGADAPDLSTLSLAAAGKTKWTIGAPLEFQTRSDGLQSFNGYHLPLANALRAMRPEALFPAFSKGELNMAVTPQTDGHLTQAEWKILDDDQHRNAPQQAVLLVKQATLKQQPKLRPALEELAGKLTLDTMRRLNAEVDLKERPVAEVAAEFLRSSGL